MATKKSLDIRYEYREGLTLLTFTNYAGKTFCIQPLSWLDRSKHFLYELKRGRWVLIDEDEDAFALELRHWGKRPKDFDIEVYTGD